MIIEYRIFDTSKKMPSVRILFFVFPCLFVGIRLHSVAFKKLKSRHEVWLLSELDPDYPEVRPLLRRTLARGAALCEVGQVVGHERQPGNEKRKRKRLYGNPTYGSDQFRNNFFKATQQVYFKNFQRLFPSEFPFRWMEQPLLLIRPEKVSF